MSNDNNKKGYQNGRSLIKNTTRAEFDAVFAVPDIPYPRETVTRRSIQDEINAGMGEDIKPKARKKAKPKVKPKKKKPIDWIIPFDCLARDIQQWMIDSAPYPQPAIAFAGTMTLMSVLIGRDTKLNGTKGNLMLTGIAKSGKGKDHPLKCVKLALEALGLDNRRGGEIASSAALAEILIASPSALLAIDEMGHYMESLTSTGSNQYLREVMKVITQIYTSASDSYTTKGVKGNPLGTKIIVPNLAVFGVSTQEQLLDNMNTKTMAEGSIARTLFVFGDDHPAENEYFDEDEIIQLKAFPKDLINRCKKLMVKLSATNEGSDFTFKASREIKVSREYKDQIKKNRRAMLEIADNLPAERQLFAPIFNRRAVMMLQMALLIDQCESVDVLKWTFDLVKQATEQFCDKYDETGFDNENEKFSKKIDEAIKEVGEQGITGKQLQRKTRAISTLFRKNHVKELIDNDSIIVEKQITQTKPTTIYHWNYENE